MDFLMKMFEMVTNLTKMFKTGSEKASKVMNVVNKLKSGISTNVKSENLTHPIGQFVGELMVKTQKDLNIDEIRLSFNQYVYDYNFNGDYKWKEYFIGTQKLDKISLKAGESKALDFNIDYEFHMYEGQQEAATKKNADIKKIISMGNFRKNGKGAGTEWIFKLVAVIVLAGGEELKEEHVIKVK